MSSAARCIVWHASSAQVPQELASALDRRGLAWSTCSNDFAALSAICGARPDDPVPTILLLVEPVTLHSLGDLLEATDRYRPSTAIWVYDSNASQRLAAGSRPDITAKYARSIPNERQSQVRKQNPNGPVLRLAGVGPTEPGIGEEGPKTNQVRQFIEPARPSPSPASHLLTDEELTMLLSTDECPTNKVTDTGR